MENKSKYKAGDLVIWNPTKEFGNEHDRLFHIHDVSFGVRNKLDSDDKFDEQFWYCGNLLEIAKYDSKGVPLVPTFYTTIQNASEDCLKGLEGITDKKDKILPDGLLDYSYLFKKDDEFV